MSDLSRELPFKSLYEFSKNELHKLHFVGDFWFLSEFFVVLSNILT